MMKRLHEKGTIESEASNSRSGNIWVASHNGLRKCSRKFQWDGPTCSVVLAGSIEGFVTWEKLDAGIDLLNINGLSKSQ